MSTSSRSGPFEQAADRTDPASGTARRRHFLKRLAGEVRAAKRNKAPLSLVMVRIDRYESHVASSGPQIVDRMIFEVARLIEGDLRSRDCVGRYSDDTFAVILPETTAAIANALAVKLRLLIGSSQFGDLDSPLEVTVSAGVSNGRPEAAKSPEELAEEAWDKVTSASMTGNKVVGASHKRLSQSDIRVPSASRVDQGD